MCEEWTLSCSHHIGYKPLETLPWRTVIWTLIHWSLFRPWPWGKFSWSVPQTMWSWLQAIWASASLSVFSSTFRVVLWSLLYKAPIKSHNISCSISTRAASVVLVCWRWCRCFLRHKSSRSWFLFAKDWILFRILSKVLWQTSSPFPFYKSN